MADSFLALIWLCFSEYQKLFHVLFLAYVVRFEVESTRYAGDFGDVDPLLKINIIYYLRKVKVSHQPLKGESLCRAERDWMSRERCIM
jgi:hypothetical protein